MLMMTIDFSYDFQDESNVSTVADVEQLLDYYYCSSMKMFSNWNEHNDENVDRDWSAM
jgi:hypothetical protein